MKPQPPPLRIGTACPKQWHHMTGDSTRRFCADCQLHVHNLSAMSDGERARFVADTRGHACIAYQLRPDGTMITPTFWSRLLAPFEHWKIAALLAAALPFLFSSCASRCTVTSGIPILPDDPPAHNTK